MCAHSPTENIHKKASDGGTYTMRATSTLVMLLVAVLVCGVHGTNDACPAGCTCSQQSVRCLKLSAVPKLPADSKIM